MQQSKLHGVVAEKRGAACSGAGLARSALGGLVRQRCEGVEAAPRDRALPAIPCEPEGKRSAEPGEPVRDRDQRRNGLGFLGTM